MTQEELGFYNKQDKEELVIMCIARDNKIEHLRKEIDGLITVIDLAKQFIRNAGCYEEETDTFCEDIANYQLYNLINILERVNEE